MLSKIREDEGDSAAASELLQDLQVETFGSMDRREKIDFILEQMRLLRVRQDWDRLGIVSKKINSAWLADAANEDLKLRFHALMIRWALHFDRYLDVCKHLRSVLECPSVASDDARRRAAIRNALLFVILAPHDNEQSDLLARVAKDPHLVELDDAHGLATCFTTPELMRWPGIIDLYGSRLRQTRVFGEVGRAAPAVAADVGDLEEENEDAGVKGQKRWDDLHTRVLEHVRRVGCALVHPRLLSSADARAQNIRVVAKYYTRITLARLSQLLDLDRAATETLLCRLVVEKSVHARIDRTDGTVNFVPPKRTDVVLNEWSSDVGKLMVRPALVEHC